MPRLSSALTTGSRAEIALRSSLCTSALQTSRGDDQDSPASGLRGIMRVAPLSVALLDIDDAHWRRCGTPSISKMALLICCQKSSMSGNSCRSAELALTVHFVRRVVRGPTRKLLMLATIAGVLIALSVAVLLAHALEAFRSGGA